MDDDASARREPSQQVPEACFGTNGNAPRSTPTTFLTAMPPATGATEHHISGDSNE